MVLHCPLQYHGIFTIWISPCLGYHHSWKPGEGMFPGSYPSVSIDVSNVLFFILRIIGLQILLFPEEIYLLENVLFLISYIFCKISQGSKFL